jgi:hypothetical protein
MFTDVQLSTAPWLAGAALVLSGLFVIASACRCWLLHGQLHPDIHQE